MSMYRNGLPQAGHDLFLTDGGIETTLIFHEGLELPDFAAFHLLSITGIYLKRKSPRNAMPNHRQRTRDRSGVSLPQKAIAVKLLCCGRYGA